MTAGQFTESVVEQAALAWFENVSWQITHGIEFALGEPGAERTGDGLAVSALVRHSPDRLRAASRRNIES